MDGWLEIGQELSSKAEGLKGMLKVGKPLQRLSSNNWESSLKDNLGNYLTANLRSLVENEPPTFDQIDVCNVGNQPIH